MGVGWLSIIIVDVNSLFASTVGDQLSLKNDSFLCFDVILVQVTL